MCRSVMTRASARSSSVNPAEAEIVHHIFAFYLDLVCERRVKEEADRLGRREAGEGAAATLTSRRRLADGGASAILMRRGDRSVR
jgi:hypothetical protein